MNKFLSIMILLVVGLLATSCGKKGDLEPPSGQAISTVELQGAGHEG